MSGEKEAALAAEPIATGTPTMSALLILSKSCTVNSIS
jgi:hypothetical protein